MAKDVLTKKTIGKGGKMQGQQPHRGLKKYPHFGTKRIENPPSDQNPESYPK